VNGNFYADCLGIPTIAIRRQLNLVHAKTKNKMNKLIVLQICVFEFLFESGKPSINQSKTTTTKNIYKLNLSWLNVSQV